MMHVEARARSWAIENGLSEPLLLSPPIRVSYPRHGHGYAVTVNEQAGKKRMASAQFTSEGIPSCWTLDGKGGTW
jgi:hypothetical protein